MTQEYKPIDTSRKVSFEEDKPLEIYIDKEELQVEEKQQQEEVQKPDVRQEQRKSRAKERIQKLANEKNEAYRLLDVKDRQIEELTKQLRTGNKTTKESLKAALEGRVLSLTKQLADAIKSGEAEETVIIQDSLMDAKGELRDLNKELSVKEEEKQPESPKEKQSQEVPERAQEWISEHPEFKTDELFRNASLTVNNQLLRAGFDPESDEFYEELDNKLKKRFPEMFGIEEENSVQLSQKSSNEGDSQDVKENKESRIKEQTVSGSSRGNSTKIQPRKAQSVTLSPADLAQAERWGLSYEQMARRIHHSETNKRQDGYVPIMINKDKA